MTTGHNFLSENISHCKESKDKKTTKIYFHTAKLLCLKIVSFSCMQCPISRTLFFYVKLLM